MSLTALNVEVVEKGEMGEKRLVGGVSFFAVQVGTVWGLPRSAVAVRAAAVRMPQKTSLL